MENYILSEDVNVFCVTAASFPDGVMAAHTKIHSLAPFSKERKYFGLSRPKGKNEIIYKAGANELVKGEFEKYNLEEIVVKKGNYASVVILDYMKNIPAIGKTFQEILARPDIDPEGWCVEWYFNEKDLQCMVRLKS